MLLSSAVLVTPATPAAADPPTPIWKDDSGAYTFEERAADLVSRLTYAEKLTQFRATTSKQGAVARVGLPAYRYWNEALHGIARVGTATAFPTGLGIGATWNTALVKEAMSAAADEARAKWNTGGNYGLTYWSPTINLNRDPRWGRAEEDYGEDPYLTGQIAGAFIDGLQGDDDTYVETVATVKHYAANNSENNRHSGSSNMPSDELHEYYLQAFQEATENHNVQSLMTAYNSLNGTPMPANNYLNNDVLRRTWGFNGFITSDCGAIDDVAGNHAWRPTGADHNVTRPEATAYSIKGGTDIDCSGGQYSANIAPAVEQGLLTEADVDIALERLFTVRMRTGEFDSNDPWRGSDYTEAKQINSNIHGQIASTMAEEATVLLKNEKADPGDDKPILPLSTAADDIDNIVLVGEAADRYELGDYSPSSVPTTEGTSNHPLNGVKKIVTELGGNAANVIQVGDNDNGTLTDDEKAKIAAADVAIVVLSTRAGGTDAREEQDRANLDFPRNQANFAIQAAALNPRTVVYMHTVGQMNIEPFKDAVPAILWATYNGQDQGNSIARVLFGYNGVEPSGRLPFTWYTDVSQLDATTVYNLAPSETSNGRTYQYFTGDVTYPFGYGLGYTDFTYSDFNLSSYSVDQNGQVTASVKVKNTGSRKGATVVQLYASAPGADGVEKPKQRLIGFEKVVLTPGGSKTVNFTVKPAELWFWDADTEREVIDNGLWTLRVGQDSDDAALEQTLNIGGERDIYVQEAYMIPNGVVIDLDNPTVIDAGLTAVANDQSFYDLADVTVRYTTSNPAVAKVTQQGKVTGVGDGVATISATVTAGGHTETASFAVSVKHAPPVLESILVDGTPLADFDPAVTKYGYTRAASSDPIPAVAATAAPGVTVTIDPATPANSYTATITADDGMGGITEYRVVMQVPLVSIDFKNKTSTDIENADWSIVRPDNSLASYGPTGVVLTSHKSDIYQSDENTAAPKNLFLHDGPGDWTATVKIIPTVPLTGNYQQAAIGYWSDDNNYVKIGYQWNGNAGVTGFAEANGAVTENATQARANNVNVGTNPIWLRLTKQGDRYGMFYSTDGNNFTLLAYRTISLPAGRFMMGAMNGIAYVQPEIPFIYEELVVDAPPTPDPDPVDLTSFDFQGATAQDLADGDWEVRNADSNISYGAAGTTIQLDTGEMYQGQSASNNPKNMLLHDWPNDGTAVVHFTLSAEPGGNYEKFVAGVFQDVDNFILFTYQYDNAAGIEWSLESGAVRQSSGRVWPAPGTASLGTDLWFKLVKTGSSYTGAYSTDGINFTTVGGALTLAGANPKLMLSAYGRAKASSGRSVTFKTVNFEAPVLPVVSPLETVDFKNLSEADLKGTGPGQYGWSVVREDGSAVSYGTADGLKVNTQSGQLWGSTNTAKNIFFHSAPGDWMATAHLITTNISANYEQVGLLAYGSDAEYIKWVRSYESGQRLQVASETADSGTSVTIVSPFASTDFYLRMIKIGNQYYFGYSTDGTSFTYTDTPVTKSIPNVSLAFGTWTDNSSTPDSTFTIEKLVIDPAPTAAITDLDFPDQLVELTPAQAGVDLVATPALSDPNTNVSIAYSIQPNARNTAGASIVNGKLVATRAGIVEVNAMASSILQKLGKQALVTVIPDGTASLDNLTPPTLPAYVREGTEVVPGAATWTVVPDELSYQWLLDGTPITGAQSDTYTPSLTDIGHQLSVRVTASHVDFPDATATSAAVPVYPPEADKTALQARIAQVATDLAAAGLVQADFKADSWADLQDALAAAQTVLADITVTQDAVDAAVDAITTAYNALELRVDTSGLRALVDAIDALQYQTPGLYTPISAANLTTALNAAKEVLAKPIDTVTELEVANTTVALNTAVGALEPYDDTPEQTAVLKNQLSAQIAAAEAMDSSVYTPDSWAPVAVALAAAEAKHADSAATISELRDALAALTAAMAGVEPVTDTPASIDRLQKTLTAAISAAEALKASDYTTYSWGPVAAALDHAKTVVSSNNGTVLEHAITQLSNAIGSLVVADTVTKRMQDVLDAQIASVTALTPSDFTPTSWAPVAAALAAAQEVAQNPSATVAQLEQAINDLSAKVAGLKTVTVIQETPSTVPAAPVVTKVKLAQSQLTLVKGKSFKVKAGVYFDSLHAAYSGMLTWKSSNTKVAKVDANGKIKALKAGKATITATSKKVDANGKKPSVKITVKVVAKQPSSKVSKVSLDVSVPKTMTVGQTVFVTGKYASGNAANVKVTYSTKKYSIVTVDAVGRVYAAKKGTDTLVIKAGGKTKTVKITVK
jgi:beta-glucosidase-like glycosyl hydrolase/uncharacterized protein YjdB/regulation of enolase protein 1 (concanavalin A-like superfamily)